MEKLQNIQFLRGLAALLVVFAHLSESVTARATDVGGLFYMAGIFDGAGGLGVDIFFVISGFIMVYISTIKESRGGLTS